MKLTAIVADDTGDIVRLLTDVLETSGISVLGRAANGKDAVDLYKKTLPDLLFLDVKMPQYDGFYALEQIRMLNPDVKVVMTTAEQTPAIEEMFDEAKPDHVIYKPCTLEDIKEMVQSIVSSHAEYVSLAIQRALLNIGLDTLLVVRKRLSEDYNCGFADCYENPEYLNRVLKDLYGNANKTIVDSIKNNLKERKREKKIIMFEKTLTES